MSTSSLARSRRVTTALLSLALGVTFAPSADAQQAAAINANAIGYVDRRSPYGYQIPPAYDDQSLYGPSTFVPAQAPDASQEPSAEKSGFSLDLGVATHVPLFVGGEATIELPHGFLLQGDIGALPSGFVSAVDAALVSANVYEPTTSKLVRGSLDSSLVGRVSLGVRPFEAHGLELLGGYTVITLAGGLSARQTIEAATSTSLPEELGDADLPVSTTIHSAHASLGWRWVLADRLVIRASLGYLQALSSTSRVELPAGVASTPSTEAGLAKANTLMQSKLDDIYTTYVKLPVLGLSAAFRF